MSDQPMTDQSSGPVYDPFTGHVGQLRDVINSGPFPIRFPRPDKLAQDEEWCEVCVDGEWKRIRFHDYDEVYDIPGLYETIFYRTLRCNSPNRVCGMLNEVLVERDVPAEQLRVLDLGAGNGMAGEALQTYGTRRIVGVDIIEGARVAALRDRPWVYEKYLTVDLMNPAAEVDAFLKSYGFNTLITVAALGFGDIPPAAFRRAYNYVAQGGLIAFNIREDFLKSNRHQGFSKLVQRMIRDEVIELDLYKRYQHRLNTAGQPLYYVGIVARKLQHLE